MFPTGASWAPTREWTQGEAKGQGKVMFPKPEPEPDVFQLHVVPASAPCENPLVVMPCAHSMLHEQIVNVFAPEPPLSWGGDGSSSPLGTSEPDSLPPSDVERPELPLYFDLESNVLSFLSLPPSAPQTPAVADSVVYAAPFRLDPPSALVPTTVPSMHMLTLVFSDSTIETKYRVSRAELVRDILSLKAYPGLFTYANTPLAVAIGLGFLWHQEASGVKPLYSPTLQSTMEVALAPGIIIPLFGRYYRHRESSQLPDVFSRFCTCCVIFTFLFFLCWQPVMATPDLVGSFRDAGFMMFFCVQCHAVGFRPMCKLIVCTLPALAHILNPVWGIGAAAEARLMVSASSLGVVIGYLTEWRVRSQFLRGSLTVTSEGLDKSIHIGWSQPTKLVCFVTGCIVLPIAIFD